jgi:hypothetical protein
LQSKAEAFSLKNAIKIQGSLNKKYIVKVACGNNFVIFLTHAGMVFSYGENSRGQLGLGNTESTQEPTMITNILNYRIVDLAVGDRHVLALGSVRDLNKSKGDSNNNSNQSNLVLVWGDNVYGQLGNFNEEIIPAPTVVEEFNELKISKIDCGLFHSVILLDNLKAYAFGSNIYSQTCLNSGDEVIKIPQKVKLHDFDFIDCRCLQHSTLYLTTDNHLFIVGEIVNKKNRLYKLSDRNNLQFIFNENEITIIHEDEKFTIKEISLGNSEQPGLVQDPILDEDIRDENIYDHIFKDFDLSKDLLSEHSDCDIFHESNNFEQSIEELRSYINLVGISYSADSTISTGLSFRPKNLPKKSPQEEEYHRRLVEENRKMYMKMLKEKQDNERKLRIKIEQRKERMKKLLKKWEVDILPAWFKYRGEINSIRVYFHLGLPAPIRGKVWLLCIGNNFSITPEYYEIELKKGMYINI